MQEWDMGEQCIGRSKDVQTDVILVRSDKCETCAAHSASMTNQQQIDSVLHAHTIRKQRGFHSTQRILTSSTDISYLQRLPFSFFLMKTLPPSIL
uniref:Uncharacterized protein n=1 Tax=Ascaris lumbricoides TaxID=6252 RepID=A0A9J2PHQ0_ASCLU